MHANDVTRHIQYGHLKTPIHTNTTWDAARFELCAHHWIDVGEPGFGVALLNDGRYGHDVTRTRGPDGEPTTTLRLTLLKGAIWPDPRADLGRHSVTCAVLPHAGRFRKEGVVAEGYRLNMPVRVVDRGRDDQQDYAFVTVDHPAVVVEAVKAAEDGSGDMIVRCYESFGGRAEATLAFDRWFPLISWPDFDSAHRLPGGRRTARASARPRGHRRADGPGEPPPVPDRDPPAHTPFRLTAVETLTRANFP